MPRNGQDVAVATAVVERGLASAEVLARLDVPPGALARELITRRIVPAPLVSVIVRELGGGRFSCPGCAKSVAYAGLGKLTSLSCPSCPNRLEYRSTAKATAPAGVPERIGPYRVVREVGRGGMGVVYEARDDADQPVAIKVLLGFDTNSTGAERFQVEAAVASMLDHPGIVPVRDQGVHAGRPYSVMDYVPGRTLAERLREDGALPVEEARRVVTALAEAVGHAHEAGVVHRDLKPGNVILRASDGAPLITDFGLARDLNRAMGMTRSGEALGTPHYMAPEQMEDAKRAGPAADVYALGVILYECLAGHRPFEANALLDLYNQIQRGQPTPLREYVPDVPPGLERACARALSRDPGDRFESAADFRAALAPGAAGTPPPAPTRAVGLAAAGLGLLLLAGAAVALVVAQRLESGVQPAPVASAPPPPPAPRDPFTEGLARVDQLHRRVASYPEISAALAKLRPLATRPALRSRLTRAALELAFRRLRLSETLRLAQSSDLRGRHAAEGRLIGALARFRRRRRVEASRLLEALAREDDGIVGATAAAHLSQWKQPMRGPDPALVRRAMTIDPRYPPARLAQYFQLLLGAGDRAGARALINALIAEAPDHFLYRWAQVTLLRESEGDPAAVGALDRIIALVQPEPFPEAVFVRSQLQSRLGDWTGALAGVNKVLQTPDYRDDFDALLFRGALRGRSGNVAGRRSDFVRAAMAAPEKFTRYVKENRQGLIMEIALQGLRWRGAESLTDEQAAARDAYARGVPEAARAPFAAAVGRLMGGATWTEPVNALLERARAAAPESFELALRHAQLLAGRQQHRAAAAAFADAERLAPRQAGVAVTLERVRGDLLVRRGAHAAGLAAYGRAAKGDGVDALLARVALALTQSEIPAQAEADVAEVLKRAPNHPRAHALAALLSYARKRMMSALREVQRGIRRGAALDGTVLAVQALALGRLDVALGRRARAREELERGVPFGGAWMRVSAVMALLQGSFTPSDVSWSRRVLQTGIKAEPRRGPLHRALGTVELVRGRPAEEVLVCYERAKALDPNLQLDAEVERFRRAYPKRSKQLAARLERLRTSSGPKPQ